MPVTASPDSLHSVEERDRRFTQVGRELVGGDREVEADADHRPAVLGLGLDQDAGELAAVDPDVVRPLDRALDSRCQLLGRLADGERDRERQQQVALVERAQDRRVEQRLAGWRRPGPPLAPAAVGLLGGGDDGAVRGAGLGQLARASVGRVGDAGSAGAARRSSSALRIVRLCRPYEGAQKLAISPGGILASERPRPGRRRRGARPRRATSRPAARAASLVIGPIETTRAPAGKRSPSASVRLRTVEDEVKVT